MSKRMHAITAYRPRIQLKKAIEHQQFYRYYRQIARMNRGEATMALLGLQDVLLFLIRMGHSVKVPHLGIFTPTISATGILRISVRLDRAFGKQLNEPGFFEGEILNAHSIGQSIDQWVERWNEEHPGDRIT